MQLSDTGEVFGHFLVPFTEERRTYQAIREALSQPQNSISIRSAALTSMAGESDLLLRLVLNDFRRIADLQAQVIDQHTWSSSWIYAIPYISNPQAVARPNELEFFVYLRVHRHFYSAYGVEGERALLTAISGLLTAPQNTNTIRGRVLYSLGWPDLIVHGCLSSDVGQLLQLVSSIQSLAFPANPGPDFDSSSPSDRQTPIFIRTITLLGLPLSTKSDEELPDSDEPSGASIRDPVLFAKCRPGRVKTALEAAIRLFEEAGLEPTAARSLDGTWDFVVTSRSRCPINCRDFFDIFEKNTINLDLAGVASTQTHILTSDPQDLPLSKPLLLQPSEARAGAPTAQRCACSDENLDSLRQLLSRTETTSRLPSGLSRTISHVLEMFRHTLRDSNNCCDCIAALRSHVEGLRTLLELSLRYTQLLIATAASDTPKRASFSTEISFVHSHLAEWCTRAGRVTREKTAGSAARLFLQVDSIVAQRGAIPKVLLIAEHLMRTFYSSLPAEVRVGKPGYVRDFAAVLEPQGNVTSQPLMGMISIPIRYAFSLHLVLPQLWHEVGQHIFWSVYSRNKRRVVDLALSELFRISPNSAAPTAASFRYKNEAFLIDYNLRSDMYADLLVFHFGFRLDFPRFMIYLSSLTANIAQHEHIHPESWNRQAVALIHRLFFVAQFLSTLEQIEKARKQGPLTDPLVEKIFHQVSKEITDRPEKFVRRVIHNVLALSEKSPGWPHDYHLPVNLVGTVSRNLQSKVYRLCQRDMLNVLLDLREVSLTLDTTEHVARRWSEIEKGELVEFRSSEALASHYYDFYLEEVQSLLESSPEAPKTPRFRKMATLGRSALLHIYQHQSF